MTDQELVEQIHQGDARAFRELHEKYMRLVFRYIHARVGDNQETEDLTAEVFIKAWQSFGGFEWNGTPVRAWLLRIAHNLVIDRYRQRRPLLEWLPWQLGYKERKFAQYEHRDEIQRALVTLPYEQQVILHLRFCEGYQLNEIADFLDKTPNAVRVAQHRALKRLRKVLRNARSRTQQGSSLRGGRQSVFSS